MVDRGDRAERLHGGRQRTGPDGESDRQRTPVGRGERQAYTGSNRSTYALQKATIYRPGLVTLSNFRGEVSHLEDLSSGGKLNYTLRIHGRASTEVTCKRGFLVLDLTVWKNRGFVFQPPP